MKILLSVLLLSALVQALPSQYSNVSLTDLSQTLLNSSVFESFEKRDDKSENMFDIVNWKCTVDARVCEVAKNAFISATLAVSKLINFKTKVILQAGYYSFCQEDKICNQGVLMRMLQDFGCLTKMTKIKLSTLCTFTHKL